VIDWERRAEIEIETPHLSATVRTEGYVSGLKSRSFVDKRTGVADLSGGIHVMDHLPVPGWANGPAEPRVFHGNLPKRVVESPQICTGARRLDYEVIEGDGFLAIRQWFTFTRAVEGFRPGSRWEQTLLFLPDTRYVLSCEHVECVNDAECLFYRIDMPGHLHHKAGDTFTRIYLSYHGEVDPSEFLEDFAPDDKLLYRRDDDRIPDRFIRAYEQVGEDGDSVWLAGMTLEPSDPCEAWCNQRGYVCFIQELHGRKVVAGQTIGAAYVVGYFDSVQEMEEAYDHYKGTRSIALDGEGFELLSEVPQVSADRSNGVKA
jgi:hypothetical protein